MQWRPIAAALVPLLATISLAPTIALAQLPATRLYALFPPGGRQDSQFDATIEAGEDLDGVTVLRFSHPGVTAEPHQGGEADDAEKSQSDRVKFRVAIADDVPPGTYDVRAIGKHGISDPRAFVVSDCVEVLERESNDRLDKAQPIDLNAIVNGTADEEGYDCYAIQAAKGQRILIDCRARAIDSQLIPAIELYDAEGRELARARQSMPTWPLIDFTAPADGAYFIRLYDFLYRGGTNFFYRLSAHVRPHIGFVMPPAGLAGEITKFEIYGRNLPGGAPVDGLSIDGQPIERLSADIELSETLLGERTLRSTFVEPEAMALDGMDYQLQSSQGLSNDFFIGAATAPVVLEQEPNDSPQAAQRVAVPCELAGQFSPAEDSDSIQFQAKRGDVLYLEVISQRLGLPTDPVLVVQRVNTGGDGAEEITVVAQADDSEIEAGGRFFTAVTEDPTIRLDVPEDGTYRVSVRDQNGVSGGDPRSVYRLCIRRPQPDFRLAATPMFPPNDDQRPTPWTTHLRRGGVDMLRIIAFRIDGFDGQIEVYAEDLPAGVTCRPAFIGPGAHTTDLILYADENASSWAGTIDVVGTATASRDGAEVELVRKARGASLLWPAARNDDFQLAQTRMTREIALSVGEETAPLLITPAEEKVWEVSPRDNLQVPLRLVRRATIKGDVALRPSQRLRGHIEARESKFSSGQDEAVAQINIGRDAPPGTYTIGFQAVARLSKTPDSQEEDEDKEEDVEVYLPATSITFTVVASPPKETSASNRR